MAAFRTQSKIKYAWVRHECREILKTKRTSLGAVRLVLMNGAPEEPCIGGRSRRLQLRGGRSRIHQLQGDRSRKLQVARIRILRIQRQVNPLAISWQAREDTEAHCDGSYYLELSTELTQKVGGDRIHQSLANWQVKALRALHFPEIDLNSRNNYEENWAANGTSIAITTATARTPKVESRENQYGPLTKPSHKNISCY